MARKNLPSDRAERARHAAELEQSRDGLVHVAYEAGYQAGMRRAHQIERTKIIVPVAVPLEFRGARAAEYAWLRGCFRGCDDLMLEIRRVQTAADKLAASGWPGQEIRSLQHNDHAAV